MTTTQDILDCVSIMITHPLANADEIRAANAILNNPSMVADFINSIPPDSPEIIPAWYAASRFLYLLIQKSDTIRIYTALYPEKKDLIVKDGKVKLAVVSPIKTNFQIPDLAVGEPEGSLPWAIDWNLTITEDEGITADFQISAVFRNSSDTNISNPTIH